MKKSIIVNQLQALEGKVLQDLLSNPLIWSSLDIDYHPPRVERLWTQVAGYRLCLHRIHKCKPEEALYHPHPWPSAMKIIDGSYEMGIGYEMKKDNIKTLANVILSPGSYYEMDEVDGCHYVAPLTPFIHSIMLIGKPWEKPSPLAKGSSKKLKPLSDTKKQELLDYFNLAIFG